MARILLMMFLVTLCACNSEAPEPPEGPVGELPQALLQGQSCDPIVTTTTFPPGDETYVPADLVNELPADARLVVPFNEIAYFAAPYAAGNTEIVSRLRGNTYILLYNLFGSIVYKGNTGLVVVDSGGHFGEDERLRLLSGLAQIGDWTSPVEVGPGLPVKVIVSTHPHADHAGNSLVLKQLFPQAAVVVSRWYADEQVVNQQPLAIADDYHQGWPPLDTSTVTRCRFDHFTFEGKKFVFNTPVRVAHTSADSYIITPDKVLMAVDFVHPNRLPFVNASVVQDLYGYFTFLRYLLGEWEAGNWEVASWGHFNVGYVRDVQRDMDYFWDMKNAWPQAVFENFVFNYLTDPNETSLAPVFERFFDGVANGNCALMPSSWSNVRFSELCKEHAEELNRRVFLSHLTSVGMPFDPANPPPPHVMQQILQQMASQILPNLRDPIAPGTQIYHRDEYCVGLRSLLKGRIQL